MIGIPPIPHDDESVHRWLCHPGGATCSADPSRLRVYKDADMEPLTAEQAGHGGV